MADFQNKIVIRGEDQTAAAFRSVSAGLDKLTAATSGLLGPLAALGSAAGFASLLKSAIDTGDELAKLAQKTGASVEALSRYQYAARLADTSNDELRGGLIKLQKNMGESLSDPASQTARTFRALGIEITDASGKLRGTDAVLNDLAKRFEAAPDGPAKTAAAVALLGRSGAEMIPFLNSMREGTAEAERLGLTVSTGFAQSAERFNDELERMSASVELFLATSEKGAPIIDALTNSLKGVTFFALGIAQGFEEAGKGLGAYAAATVAVAHFEFKQAHEILQLLDQDLADIQKRGEAARAALFSDKPITKLPQLTSQAINLPSAAAAAAPKLGNLGQDAADAIRAEAELSPGFSAAGLTQMAEQVHATFVSESDKLSEAKQAALDRDFGQLSQVLLSETDLVNAKYASDLQTLYDARAAEYLTESQFKAGREQLEIEHQAKLGDVEAQGIIKRQAFDRMTKVEQTKYLTGWLLQITSATASHNKTMFEINKAAGIVHAIISTEQGMAEALKWGWPLGPIFAGIIGLAGAANIKMIASASFGSATSAPSIGGGGAIPVTNVGATPGGDVGSITDLKPQTAIQITVQGNVYGNQDFSQYMTDIIRDAVNNRDLVIINGDSRQAIELRA